MISQQLMRNNSSTRSPDNNAISPVGSVVKTKLLVKHIQIFLFGSFTLPALIVFVYIPITIPVTLITIFLKRIKLVTAYLVIITAMPNYRTIGIRLCIVACIHKISIETFNIYHIELVVSNGKSRRDIFDTQIPYR
jgi:hypothetical protein